MENSTMNEAKTSVTDKLNDMKGNLGQSASDALNSVTGKVAPLMHATAADHTEGGLALPIENMTARLPSDTFLWAALGSIGASLTLYSMGRKHDALFVGQWAPTFLIMGLYNKIVKVAGHDRLHHGLH